MTQNVQHRLTGIPGTWNFYKAIIIAFLFISCNGNQNNSSGKDTEQQLLAYYGLTRDNSSDSSLKEILKGINCITGKELHRELVFASNFDPADSGKILIVPFQSLLGDYTSGAYSDLANRTILLSPQLIAAFNKESALNETTSLDAVVCIMLLHELGHFALGKPGAFDSIAKTNQSPGTGQMTMNTTPEYIGLLKRVELSADSIAIAYVKKYQIDYKAMDCYGVASGIRLALPGMAFQLFGTRILHDFGSPHINLLRDPSKTHPNMELRIAFMNYFLSDLPEQKRMIDDYLYEREVAPIHRQELDPRIYQGDKKILPGDNIN